MVQWQSNGKLYRLDNLYIHVVGTYLLADKVAFKVLAQEMEWKQYS